MLSASVVQLNGFTFSLCMSIYSRMACSIAHTERNTPRWIKFLVISAKNRST